VALLAHHPQKAVLAHPAAQGLVELLANILRQRAILRFDASNEIRVVRLYQGVQQRALGCVARVARCGGRQARSITTSS
jgi:hypothetical protein